MSEGFHGEYRHESFKVMISEEQQKVVQKAVR